MPARTLAYVSALYRGDTLAYEGSVMCLVLDLHRDVIAVLSSDEAVSEILHMTPSGKDYTPGRAVRKALQWQPFGAERSES